MTRLLAVGLGSLIVVLAQPCQALEAPAATADRDGSPWSGVSVSPAYAWDTVPIFGGARDAPRSMFSLDLRLHRPIVTRKGLRLDYTAGIVPVELEGGTVVEDPALGQRKQTVYGAGIDPVGFFALFGDGTSRLFASFRGGARLFQKAVPNPRGIRFDFTADFALGLARRVGGHAWLTAGPEFHHVSNGGLGDFNPSLNYVALRVGVLVERRDH